MKFRNSFVSNSSSSSFVLLFPEDFDYKDLIKDFPDVVQRQLADVFEMLLIGGFVNYDDICFDVEDQEEFEDAVNLEDLLLPYVVEEFETGPDDGGYLILDTKEIKKHLGMIG